MNAARILKSEPRGMEFKVFAEYTINDIVLPVEVFRAASEGAAHQIMKERVAQLVNPQTINAGPVNLAPPPQPPDPKPEELAAELALKAWLQLRDALAATIRDFGISQKLGDGKVTQADVDAAWSAVKTDYIDAYAPHLGGLI